MNDQTGRRRFSWAGLQFTYADALTEARFVMLPFLLYAILARLPSLAVATFAAMITTDLVDGRIARLTGQSSAFGGFFDSTVDFAVIYSMFTVFFAIGLIPWWKWIVIFVPGLLIAVTQILHAVKAKDVVSSATRAAKVVGQIQYLYIPFLIVRTFWWSAAWSQTADDVIFAVLAAAIVVNTIHQTQILIRVLTTPAGKAGR